MYSLWPRDMEAVHREAPCTQRQLGHNSGQLTALALAQLRWHFFLIDSQVLSEREPC